MNRFMKYLFFVLAISSGQSMIAQCNTATAFDLSVIRSECVGEPGVSTLTIMVTYSKNYGSLCLGWNYTINGATTTIDPVSLVQGNVAGISITHTVTNVPCDAVFSGSATAYYDLCSESLDTPCENATATFSSPPSLPVELAYFRGRLLEDKVVLDWRTESEVNNESFEIQRSTDNNRFTTIDMIPGQGSTNEVHDYRYIDQNPYIGSSFYRLKQTDYDGAFEYSPTIEVRKSTSHSGVKLSPNPLSLGVGRQIIIESDAEYPAQILITDMNGREVYRSNKNLASGINAMTLPSNTIPGIYLVSIQYGVTTVTEKMVVIE